MKREHIFLVFGIVAGLIVGYFIGAIAGEIKFNNKLEALKDFFPPSAEIRSFGTSIKEIGPDYLIVIGPPAPNPLEKWPETRKVFINQETRLNKLDLSSPRAAGEKIPSEEKIAMTDLKINDKISIEAEEDIRLLKSFTAKRILLIE